MKYKDIHQYHHFKSNCKLTQQTFEIKPKYEEIVDFYVALFSFHCPFDEAVMFCFGKFRFLLVVGDMLKQKHFRYPRISLSGRQYYRADIEIFLYSISISTQPNDLPTNINTVQCIPI